MTRTWREDFLAREMSRSFARQRHRVTGERVGIPGLIWQPDIAFWAKQAGVEDLDKRFPEEAMRDPMGSINRKVEAYRKEHEMLNQLRGLQIDKYDLDEIVYLDFVTAGLLMQYESYDLEPPEFLVDAASKLQFEIGKRREENLSKALKLAEAERTSLRSIDEKRKDLDARISRLKSKVRGAAPTPTPGETPTGDNQ